MLLYLDNSSHASSPETTYKEPIDAHAKSDNALLLLAI